MKWISLFITLLLEVFIVWGIKFMHNRNVIIIFLIIVLLTGWIIQESREDMPDRPKKILWGFMFGTYIAAITISMLIKLKHIPV